MNIHSFLLEKIQKAIISLGVKVNCKVQLRQSTKPQFGDYQINGIMSIAKELNIPPFIMAENVVKMLNLSDIAYKINIANPGFINIYLNPSWVEEKLKKAILSPRLDVSIIAKQNIVIDYSGPNVAKEMHIGNIRSTIIGDSIARTLEFLGHNVIRANHIGDWGTQFGMLIAYLEKMQKKYKLEIDISNIENIYRDAKHHYDTNHSFAELSRKYVVKLQSGDKYCLDIWRKLIKLTLKQNQLIYDKLKVSLTYDNIMGESMYNNMLPNIIEDLQTKGIAVEKNGAIIVFLDEFRNKDGKSMGVIIKKKDGAYLYVTTDIACVKYRYKILKADRIIYYIDSRQHQHLMQAWTIAKKAEYIPNSFPIEHHSFGMILGKDGKPFKTRTGNTIKISKLINEAYKRATELIAKKNTSMNSVEVKKLTEVISIGAIKYADLSKNRTTDYIFNWEDMLNFDGNTAPYMLYAYTRIISIFKCYGQNYSIPFSNIQLKTKAEMKLGICLLQLEETITIVAKNGTPHILCNYLYKIAKLFSSFYESCPILIVKDKQLKQSRLQLSLLTAYTIKQGLNLLGIDVVDQM